MATIYHEVEIDVDLSDFETDELIDELKYRGEPWDEFEVGDLARGYLESVYNLYRDKKDYTPDLEKLFWHVLGRM